MAETLLQQAERARRESAWQALADCCFGPGREPCWGTVGIASLISSVSCVFIYACTDYKNQSASIGAVSIILCLLSLCFYSAENRSSVRPRAESLNAVDGAQHIVTDVAPTA